MHVHLSILGATQQGGNNLLRVQQARRIKAAFDGHKGIQFIARKLHAHLIDFLHPDSVLASDCSTDLDAEL